MPTFLSKFELGDEVVVDNDKNYVVTVVGHVFRSNGSEVEISWFASGTLQTAWVPEWRIRNRGERS